MAILKCKMCGGNLEIDESTTVCECEYCGSKQTIPVVDDEKKITLYERANRLRFNCEFDKATSVYESIVADYHEEAEAYWGMVLCKFGIEYVDDPATGKKVPTCHRSSFDSVMQDADFEMVMENADGISRQVYREQAKAIEEIRKGIIEVSGKEAPYDIFICYKETDENGDRTIDSVLAQDVYDALEAKGYRVFFSRITLEDKLGTEYEPYIFAALNSAKVMLAFGTSYDYYNAVWVKNEWSRFLKLMTQDKGKHLIPCYKDIDAYDIPKEFARLQAQDLGKLGAVQDLVRGVEKLIGRNITRLSFESLQQVSRQEINNIAGTNINALIQRGFMALEDKEWEKADGFFEDVLNADAQNVNAYLGKLMAECCVSKKEDFNSCEIPYDDSKNYEKVIRFGNLSLKQELEQYSIVVNRNVECIKKADLIANVIRNERNNKVTSFFKKQIEDKESIIKSINNRIVELNSLKNELSIFESDVSRIEKEIERITHEMSLLDKEYSSLGVFAKAKKNELESKYESLRSLRKRKEDEMSITKMKMKGCTSESINVRIEQNYNEIEMIKVEINEINAKMKKKGNYDDAIKLLNDESIRNVFMKRYHELYESLNGDWIVT